MKTLLFEASFIVDGLLFVSLTAAAIVVFGEGLCRLFSHCAASYRHAIWLATSVCVLATPVVSTWVPGILPRFSDRANHATRLSTVPGGDLSDTTSPLRENEPVSTNFVTSTNTADSSVEQPTPPERSPQASRSSNPTMLSWMNACLVVLWIVGALIYLLRIWRARNQLARLFRNGISTIEQPLASLIEKIACDEGLNVVSRDDRESQRLGSNYVALTATEAEVGPLVWGLMPARLLIPLSLAKLRGDAQEAAIRHEFAHVKRGDEWVRRYLVILRAVFWFHPMVRYCCDQVQLHAEKACDDHVLRVGHKPSEYSELLLKLGQKQSGIETTFALSSMAQSQIPSRIKSVLQSNLSRRPMTRRSALAVAVAMLIATSAVFVLRPSASASNTTGQGPIDSNGVSRQGVGLRDWPQWGGSSTRNNVTSGQKIPLTWDVESGQNIRWSMPLGSSSYGGVVVANSKVFTGTNNGSGYLARFPKTVDLGVLLCFNETDGKFLWQHSNAKLPTGRVNDWPTLGICSAPLVDGDRLWYVTNRGEVVCLDTEGFWDGEDDGPLMQEELADKKNEADVVWVFDMMKQLGVSQHNMANCSVTCAGELLFVNTSQGVDNGHMRIPVELAPSFICLSRKTGGILWTDNSPGNNILHGQWSSPAYAVLGGVPQVIFGGGDGYLYGFLAQGENGNSRLLWKFDCNPKDSLYTLGGSATRNHIVATPVIYDGLVYVAVGEDPEHGEGNGHVWCIDPTKRGDVSPTLVYNMKSPDQPIAHKRLQALVAREGDFEKLNPNSAAIWHYVGSNPNEFEQAMHRTVSTVAIKNDLLFVPDFSGLFHCLDAKTGKPNWTYDMLAACWASPLIVDDRVYIGDEDGELAVFKLSSKMELLRETDFDGPIYTTPVVANDSMFLSIGNRLWAIQEGAKSAPVTDK